MTEFTEIKPKNQKEIMEENLRLRKKLKNKNENFENLQNKIETARKELFRPIIESNTELQNEIKNEIKNDRNQIAEILNNFEKVKVNDTNSENMVSNYVKELSSRSLTKSNAGYSLRINPENKITIGNNNVEIQNDTLKIGNKNYKATHGLMELLIKKSPNFTIITENDKKSYLEILDDSNAIFRNFDPSSKYYNVDSSEKWKFIREAKNLVSPTKNRQSILNNSKNSDTSIKNRSRSVMNNTIQSFHSPKTGSSINYENIDKIILPSDPDSLLEMLKLSIGSYKAGNKNEFNKISCILDELLKLRLINKQDLKTIYKSL